MGLVGAETGAYAGTWRNLALRPTTDAPTIRPWTPVPYTPSPYSEAPAEAPVVMHPEYIWVVVIGSALMAMGVMIALMIMMSRKRRESESGRGYSSVPPAPLRHTRTAAMHDAYPMQRTHARSMHGHMHHTRPACTSACTHERIMTDTSHTHALMGARASAL